MWSLYKNNSRILLFCCCFINLVTNLKQKIMKKLLFLFTAILINVSTSYSQNNVNDAYVADFIIFENSDSDLIMENERNDDYNEGFEDGYCEGWKDVKGDLAICPVTPVPPLPLLNEDRYKDGYNRGFKRGYMDARENEDI